MKHLSRQRIRVPLVSIGPQGLPDAGEAPAARAPAQPTLRDRIALVVMKELIVPVASLAANGERAGSGAELDGMPVLLAGLSYAIADAMIARRTRPAGRPNDTRLTQETPA